MAYSYFEYEGTDTTIQTDILCVSTEHMYAFEVLSEEKSSVTLSDVALAATFTKNNAGVLCELNTAPSTKIRIIRSTPYDVLMHDFSNGAQFNANSVDEVYEQLLYLCQEVVEGKLMIDNSGIFSGAVALGYTPVNKAGDTLTGVLKVNGGSGNHAGIKGDIDHDTGWEWEQDGVLKAIVNGVERIHLASVPGDGTTKISSAAGNYVLLQDNGKMVYYNPAHQPIFDSSRVQTVDILTGTITDGGTIPLPSGYTQEQCFWMVSMASDNPSLKSWDINETTSNVNYRFECSADAARLVRAKMYWQGHGVSGSVPSTANYIIIGKKYGAI